MDIHYGSLLKKSWKDLKNNLIVFLPLLYSILFGLGLVIIIALEILAGFLLKLNKLDAVSIAVIVVLSLIDLFLIFVLRSAISSMSIGLLNKAITKTKATSKDMWLGMRKFTWSLFRLEMIKILFVLLPLIILGLITLLGFLVSKTLGIVLAVIFGIIYVLYLIALIFTIVFGLFFFAPIISEGKTSSVVQLIKISFRYTKENFGHVLLTWLITIGIGLVLTIPQQFVSLPAQLIPGLFLFLIPVILVFIVLNIIISTWVQLFVFNAYFNKNIKKL